MNTDTGEVRTLEEIRKMEAEMQKRFKEMALPPTEKQMARRPPRVGRNDPCPCGSRKKFKKCCWTGRRP